jgi:hypothetical protein
VQRREAVAERLHGHPAADHAVHVMAIHVGTSLARRGENARRGRRMRLAPAD